MEFFTIGTSKIKIILSKEEATERGISRDSSLMDEQRRRSFRRILDEAKEKVGFDAGAEKVLVQIYSTATGGIELFVSKLGIVPREARGMISQTDGATVLSTKRIYYIFSCLEDLLGAVRCIDSSAVEDSSAYLLDGGGFCLSICEKEGLQAEKRLSLLLEFGKKLNTGQLFSLEEHATPIALGDAVERLSEL